ncbi:MAG: hypothetical protein JJU45_17725 [Acidimicrobiia bacterium]|nr:hypothetical protein [Acidimicrobiia bacterium]
MREPSDYWTELADELAELGVRPVLIGGLAANAYRTDVRLTVDVDFLVTHVDGVVELPEAKGMECRLAVDDGSPYAVFARGAGMRVDVLVAETSYQREAIERAVDGQLTAEDVVVHKVLAWRPRDRDDLVSILRSGIELDEAYIERWVAAWQVGERWEEARRGVG